MAKPILKWMRDETQKGRFYKSDPFRIEEIHAVGFFVAKLTFMWNDMTLYMGRNLGRAKSACESLASKIIAATKGRHGK